uniref:Uncharacterized protein n=1 Tax=Strongyloides papillosus TaxID=174720 RepID=A0A0N5BUA3_STREA
MENREPLSNPSYVKILAQLIELIKNAKKKEVITKVQANKYENQIMNISEDQIINNATDILVNAPENNDKRCRQAVSAYKIKFPHQST